MRNFDVKNYFYHGIVDWLNYGEERSRDDLCLDKLDSILKFRYIYRPCDFKKNGIIHNDTANIYTCHFTFVACHPESIYASRFRKDIKEDNGYMVATEYSKFGILLDPKLLEELSIYHKTFCDKEIVIIDNISIDKYGVAIYINPIKVSENSFQRIRNFIKKYNYDFNIINLFDGTIVESIDEEKEKIKKLIKL